jgi:hypothetical protein
VNARVPGLDADAGHLHPATTANEPALQRGRLPWKAMEGAMSSTLIPACALRGLRFASRQLPGPHIREDHLQRHRHAEPGDDQSGDPGGPVGETGTAAVGGPVTQAARLPGTSPDTGRAALASAGPPRHMRRPAGPVADEVEPQTWPYRLPAGWWRVTGLDGPAMPAQERPHGRQDRHRQPEPARRASLPDPGADSPELHDAQPRASRARPRRIPDPRGVLHRLHGIAAGIWPLQGGRAGTRPPHLSAGRAQGAQPETAVLDTQGRPARQAEGITSHA